MAALDGQPTRVDLYQTALDAAAAHCTQGEDQLAKLALAGRDELAKHGITENALSVLQHVTTAASGATGKVDCVSTAAAYTILREG